MLHAALVTLALACGECPECQRPDAAVLVNPNQPGVTGAPLAPALIPPAPTINHPSIIHTIPRPIVGCTGQNCFSATRPFLPGVPVFNYRQDFNYPWSQVPCALRGPGPPLEPYLEEYGAPEEVPTPLMESSRRTKTPAVASSRPNARATRQVPGATTRR